MITINGKEYGLKFNVFGIEKMQDKNEPGSTMSSIYAMVWGGIEGNRYAKENDIDYTFDQVIDAIDEMKGTARSEFIASVTKIFTESQAYLNMLPELPVIDGEEKKNQPESSDMTT